MLAFAVAAVVAFAPSPAARLMVRVPHVGTANNPRFYQPATITARLPAKPAKMFTPPVCGTLSAATATALCSGTLAVGAQLFLVATFRRWGDCLLQDSAGYISHHIIALAFMILATVVGFAGWFSPAADAATGVARMLSPSGTSRWLAAVLLGELLLWDFPCALFIKKLREPIMLAHHTGMVITAYLVVRLPSFYGMFYLGWTELSSIAMQLWEAFSHLCEAAAEIDYPEAKRNALAKRRDLSFVVFKVLYVVVRILAFTAITACGLYPDTLRVLRSAAGGASRLPLMGFLVLSAAFNALMLYPLAEAIWKAVKPSPDAA